MRIGWTQISFNLVLLLYLFTLIPFNESAAIDLSLARPEPELSPVQTAEQVYFVDHFYAFDNLLIGYDKRPMMQLFSYSGKSVSQIATQRMITHQPAKAELKTRDLVIFRNGKLKGTGMLVDDFKALKPMLVKMWLPSLRKIRRFSEPDLDDIWGGSHLTYGDLYLRRPIHEQHELISDDNPGFCLSDPESMKTWIGERLDAELSAWCDIQQRTLLLLKSIPVEPSPHYDYRLRWVDPESYAEYQVEYFKGGERVKRIQKNWHSSGLDDPRAQIWNFWSVRVFENGKTVGESLAWVDDEAYQWNIPVDSRQWSERSLRKIRR